MSLSDNDRPVAIAGKNSIAVSALIYAGQALGIERLVVIPNPEDDGTEGWQPSLRKTALELGFPVADIADVYDRPGLILISLEYSKLLDPGKFASDRLYNIHFSLLPAYRGMFTSAWPILNGERETGVTLHEIDHGIDTGPILDQERIAIDDRMTARDLYIAYLQVGFEVFRRNFDDLVSGGARRGKPQESGKSSYYSRKSIDYANLSLDWHCPAEQVLRQLRAFTFKEYQLPRFGGRNIAGWSITPMRSLPGPGRIVAEENLRLVISTMDFDVELLVDEA